MALLLIINEMKLNHWFTMINKIVIFIMTVVVLFTGVIIHQDSPSGPMINVITGISTMTLYFYLLISSLKHKDEVDLSIKYYSIDLPQSDLPD